MRKTLTTVWFWGLLMGVLTAQPDLPSYFPLYLQDEIATIRIQMEPSDVEWMFEDVEFAATYTWPCTFIYETSFSTDTLQNVGIRLRGNTSLYAPKKSFKIDFNEFQEGLKFHGVEKLNLNGESNDPSLLRSALTWRVLREGNLPGARTSHVRVYLNDEYRGLYLNTEHFDEEWADTYQDNGNGNLYKCLWPADLNYISSNPDDYKFEVGGRRTYELKTNTDLDDYADLAQFIDVLNNATDDFQCEIRDEFNVPDYLKTLAVDVLTANWDGYAYNKNNFYLHHNQKTGVFDYVAYDLDNSWGIDWINVDWAERNPYDWNSEFRPLYERLMETPEFRGWFTYYLHQALNSWFTEASVAGYIQPRLTLASDAIAEDTYFPQAFGFDLDDFLAADEQAAGGHVEYGLLDWVANRTAGIAEYLEAEELVLILNHLRDGGFDPDTLRFKVTAESNQGPPEVTLWLDDGLGEMPYPMFDDGLHDDRLAGDGLYGVVLPIDPNWQALTYRVQASAGDLERWFPCAPRPLGYAVAENPAVILNELMARNVSTVSDEAGEFEDWCELFNATATPVNLEGYWLSDDPSTPDKWPLPNQVLEPGDWLLCWLDEDESQGELHANFKLDGDGESLGLYFWDETHWVQQDAVSFGPQQLDFSRGREFDAAQNWVDFSTATPDASNQEGIVSISESANNSDLYAWPVPAKQWVYFNEKVTGKVVTADGKIQALLQQQNKVNVSAWPVGVYFLMSDHQVIRILKR